MHAVNFRRVDAEREQQREENFVGFPKENWQGQLQGCAGTGERARSFTNLKS
jgi:hypothetical protein